MLVNCIQCSKECSVIPARAKSFKFCSYACRGVWRTANWSCENNPAWTGGDRKKTCEHCGVEFEIKSNQPITTFRKQKFCTKDCADKGGIRHEGENHPNYKPDSRRKSQRGKHGAWARSVLSRDNATCQSCGAQGVELHAHHIKPFAEYPELRWDIGNGITLCYKCHWEVHAASNAKRVNSGNIPPGNAEDNPEPSLKGNLLEGVTTNGRAYRRWNGECDWCKKFISKPLSDTVGKKALFCSKSCASKWRVANGMAFAKRVNGSNADTSALPERDDIV